MAHDAGASGLALVTVLMPTYNRAQFILEAVASVLSQSYANLELIVIDDGSTDDTLARLASLADPRIKILTRQHVGIPAALNAGLAAASGSYIARLDSDDVWVSTMLADQVSVLVEHPDVDVVFARTQIIDSAGVRQNKFWGEPLRFPDDPLLSILYYHAFCTITVVYRRRLYDRVGRYREDQHIAEDFDLNLRAAGSSRFLFRDAIVAFARRHHGNTTGNAGKLWEARRTVLDRFFASEDVPPRALAARAQAYSNTDAEYGLDLASVGQWREAWPAFRTAIREAPNPARAAVRILWFLGRTQWASVTRRDS